MEAEFSLLENGLDFIHSALDFLAREPLQGAKSHSKRELKYALLHMCAGIELVLKEFLRRKDWKLLFVRPDIARKELFERGEFKSVSLEESIERIRELDDDVVNHQQEEHLLNLKRRRNRAEHFRFKDSPESLVTLFVQT